MTITQVRERPILFSAPMVKAILDGRKTQTRRVMKVQPDLTTGEWRMAWDTWQKYMGYPMGHDLPLSPWGTYGDRMWVRETWAVGRHHGATKPSELHDDVQVWYRAGGKTYPVPDDEWQRGKWRPSIYMPRWASRITLEMTKAIRVQRIQEITDDDILAEGGHCTGAGAWEWFIPLWDKLNAKRGYGWDANPFVWVVEFKRIES